MERFTVVVFRLIQAEKGTRFRETGGGVVFLPEPRPESWHAMVAAMVKKRFRHALGPCIEVGTATLDRDVLERHCQRDGDLLWQGGDG